MRRPAEASRANVFQYSHSSKSAQSEREAALKLCKCILSWREGEPRLAPTVARLCAAAQQRVARRAYPLTAPKVMPRIRYFCANKAKTIIGTIITTLMAAIGPH